MQMNTKAEIALAHTAEMRRCSRIAAPFFLYHRTRSGFEILLRRDNGFVPNVQINPLGEASSPVRDKKELAVEAWRRSAGVYKALQYAT